jgi:ADP-heptose:LPS heptosyltransferase
MEQQRKILLVQLFSNGDCLYATAVARQIKKDYPGCHLTWAIAGFCKSIIANNPYVDEIMEVNSVAKNDVVAFRKFKKEVAQKKIIGEFDQVFITHNMDTNQAL